MFLYILLWSGLAGLATICGVLFVLAKQEWAKKNSIYIISLAAGTLLSVAFLHLLPEAVELSSQSFLVALLAILFFYILEHTFVIHSCVEEGYEEETHTHIISKISVFGMGVHSLFDGLAIGVGFEINYQLGIIATIAILVHKFPEGVSILGILLHGGFEKSKAIFYASLIALATPASAILTYFFLKSVPTNILGLLLAFSAGSFIYIAASDLIPQTHRKFHFANILFLSLGIGLIVLVKFLG